MAEDRTPGAGGTRLTAALADRRARRAASRADARGGTRGGRGTGGAGGEDAGAVRRGPGRLLIALYGVFALSALPRAAAQIATQFHVAPLAYLLSAFSAVVYLVAVVALLRATPRAHAVATAAVVVELVGVLGVGTLTVLDPQAFPDETVWSDYGSGYYWVPLLLPFLGLWWLHHVRRAAAR